MLAEIATTHTLPEFPRRFRSAEERNARIARPLARIGRVREVDEDLLNEIGRRTMMRDEIGADLAAAMRKSTPPDERVTMAALRRAVEHGARDDDPPPLHRFVAALERAPEWLDRDLLERGAAAYRRMGRTRADILLSLALIAAYRYEGPPDLLVATGGLAGNQAMRRLGETLAWHNAVSAPGGMARDGEGFRMTAHVRAMHALVNDRFERDGRWDTARLGVPISRSDLAGTLGLFSATALLGARMLGWRVSRAESDAVMHFWRYVGWLTDVDEQWLFASEREQHAFHYHLLLAQGGPTPAGEKLTTALIEGQRRMLGGGLLGWWQRRRVLGHLLLFVRRDGLHDLGQPVLVPWTLPPQVVYNIVLSRVVARTAAGRQWLERQNAQLTESALNVFLGRAPRSPGALPVT
jgi:hypothetical protein